MMKTPQGLEVFGVRGVVSDLLHCPQGFHYEVWGEMDGDGRVEIWTSQLLGQNTWTINHKEGEESIFGVIHEVLYDAEWSGEHVTLTQAVLRAIDLVWA